MISRYDGTCHYCKRFTKAGVDHYSMGEKISFHERCRAEANGIAQPAPTDAEALAEALGYRLHSEE